MHIKALLICDDVRVEENGKHILIGVYSGSVVLPKLPGDFAFMIWMQIAADESLETEQQVRLRAKFGDADPVFEMSATVQLTKLDEPATIFLGPVRIIAGGAGILSFEASFDDGEWQVVHKSPVTSIQKQQNLISG